MIFDPQNKVVLNVETVLSLLKGGNPPPILVEIDPSNTCNHGCRFCISSYIHLPESKNLATYNKEIMQEDTLLQLCVDLCDMGVKAVNWTGGGEPTVNPSLHKAISALKGKIKMGMFTNGILLDRNNLMSEVVDSLTWVRISVDAGNKETYESIRRTRPNQGWDKMVSNLTALLQEKKIRNSNIDVGVGFVITPENYTQIVEFAQFFDRYDVTYCQFKPEIVNKERKSGVQNTVEFWELISPLLDKAKEILGEKFQINGYKLNDLKTDPNFFGRTYKKCLGSQVQPCVGADGHVYVCTNQRGYKQYSYGSIYEKSFKEIWADVGRRKAVMFLIDDVEKFSNCTQLCKPHESNKKMWEIYENLENEQYILSLLDEKTKIIKNIKHPEFI